MLWKDRAKSDLAAESLKLAPRDLLKLGIVDEIIPEPLGGAHKDFETTARNLRTFLLKGLNKLKSVSPDDLLHNRYEKFRQMGIYSMGGTKPDTDSYSSEETDPVSEQTHDAIERTNGSG